MDGAPVAQTIMSESLRCNRSWQMTERHKSSSYRVALTLFFSPSFSRQRPQRFVHERLRPHLQLLGSVWAWPDSQPSEPSPWPAGPVSGTAAGWTVGPKAGAWPLRFFCDPVFPGNLHSEGKNRRNTKVIKNVNDWVQLWLEGEKKSQFNVFNQQR